MIQGKRRIGFCVFVLFMMVLTLLLALLGFEHVSFDWQRYDRYQEELNVAPSVGVSPEELSLVQRDMADALKSGSLYNRAVTMHGEPQPIFNEREMRHMDDVLALFGLERRVRNVLLGLLAVLALALMWLRAFRREHALCGLWALLGWALVALALAVACGFSFDTAFIRFHELLFTNDLWQLNPATDAMIRMYPQQFFAWMARDIGLYMGALVLTGAALPLLLLIKKGSHEQPTTNSHTGD